MITIYDACLKYAESHGMEPISHNIRKDLGKFISKHFKQFWGPKQSDDIIAQAGFMRATNENMNILVYYYPDSFESEIMARMELFFQYKKEKREIEKKATDTKGSDTQAPIIEATPARKRKRIPLAK